MTSTGSSEPKRLLRIALPNKGALHEPASALFAESGYVQRSSSKELVLVDEANEVEFFFLRPRDIAVYVGTGTVDVGITGEDMLMDSGTPADVLMRLGFAVSTFRFAAPRDVQDPQLEGARIATSYDRLVTDHLQAAGISAEVVHLDGAVESSIQLGIADVIADVVETGSTLRAAGLATFGDPIVRSEAVLFSRPGIDLDPARAHTLEVLRRRIRGVLVAREYVLLDFDIAAENLDRAVEITPGFESPTVSPLHGRDWYAVRSMVSRRGLNAMMDELYEAGARAILVTDIQACRI